MNRIASTFCVLVLSACAPPAEPVTIRFAAVFGGVPIDCADALPSRLTDLRFYVHDVAVVLADGTERPVRLLPDGTWQSERVGLIDLETGDGACLNGTPETHSALEGVYDGGAVRGLRFTIGVPAALNHRDPLSAAAPLGYSVMHWHWASGYKFLRAGIETAGDGVFLHLGSSRCEGTIGDIRGCRSANRPVVAFDAFDPVTDRIVIDLGELFAATDFGDGQRSDCMSGPANTDCEHPFEALGIDWPSGESVSPPTAFRVESGR